MVGSIGREGVAVVGDGSSVGVTTAASSCWLDRFFFLLPALVRFRFANRFADSPTTPVCTAPSSWARVVSTGICSSSCLTFVSSSSIVAA